MKIFRLLSIGIIKWPCGLTLMYRNRSLSPKKMYKQNQSKHTYNLNSNEFKYFKTAKVSTLTIEYLQE